MNEHTPGSWRYQMRPPDEEGGIRNYADIDSDAGGPVTVASFYGEDDTNEADARLIAAAPDLLDALRSLLEEVDYQRSLGAFSAVLSKREAARNAIAKATPVGSRWASSPQT